MLSANACEFGFSCTWWVWIVNVHTQSAYLGMFFLLFMDSLKIFGFLRKSKIPYNEIWRISIHIMDYPFPLLFLYFKILFVKVACKHTYRFRIVLTPPRFYFLVLAMMSLCCYGIFRNEKEWLTREMGLLRQMWMLPFLPDCLTHRPGQCISYRWLCGSAEVTVFCCDFGLICTQKFACTDLFSTIVLENQGEML